MNVRNEWESNHFCSLRKRIGEHRSDLQDNTADFVDPTQFLHQDLHVDDGNIQGGMFDSRAADKNEDIGAVFKGDIRPSLQEDSNSLAPGFKPLPSNRYFNANEILDKFLHEDHSGYNCIPDGHKKNAYIILEDSANLERPRASYQDFCNAYDRKQTHRTVTPYLVRKGWPYTAKYNKDDEKYYVDGTCVDSLRDDEYMISLVRRYWVATDNGKTNGHKLFSKRVTTVENGPLETRAKALVEYKGDFTIIQRTVH